MVRIESDIRELVAYGVRTGLVPREDIVFTVNRLLELFGLEEFEESQELGYAYRFFQMVTVREM